MTRDDYFQTVTNTTHEEWDVDQLATETRGLDDHERFAVLRRDIDVSIAWGSTAQENFTEGWVQRFPDKQAQSVYVDFRYRGALVRRSVSVEVDGGRYLLPLPSAVGDKWEVVQRDLPLADLLFDLHVAVPGELAATLKRAGVIVV